MSPLSPFREDVQEAPTALEWQPDHAHEEEPPVAALEHELDLAAEADRELEGLATHATEEVLGGYEEELVADEASLDSPTRILESEVGGFFSAVRRGYERVVLLADIRAGQRSAKELTNKIFLLRHPDRRGTPIKRGEDALAREWVEIQARLVLPLLLTGPYIGPLHAPAGTPVGPELRKGVPADAVLSPLSITLRGLRQAPSLQPDTIATIVVHNTSRGPANRSSAAGYKKPAVEYALGYYVDGDGGFPHYVVDFNGTVYATCDERRVAHHAGWVHKDGAKVFTGGWIAPEWWSAVWSKLGVATPLNLLAKGARSPNHRTIGIELLILPDLSFTSEQYRGLARLVVDIKKRNPDVQIPSAPSRGLLGHEDFAPVTAKGGRADAKGGWDPGAHRQDPYFDWGRVWSEIQAVSPGFGAGTP